MALSKIAIYFILIFAVLNVTTLFPNIQNFFAQVHDILRSWMPLIIDLMEEIALRIHKYCTERLFEDIKKGLAIITDLVVSAFALVQPAMRSVLEVIIDGLVAFHNNGMGYTDEILQQVLGIDGKNSWLLITFKVIFKWITSTSTSTSKSISCKISKGIWIKL